MMESALIKSKARRIDPTHRRRIGTKNHCAEKLEIGIKNSIAMFVSCSNTRIRMIRKEASLRKS